MRRIRNINSATDKAAETNSLKLPKSIKDKSKNRSVKLYFVLIFKAIIQSAVSIRKIEIKKAPILYFGAVLGADNGSRTRLISLGS